MFAANEWRLEREAHTHTLACTRYATPVVHDFDYSFSENGLVAYHNGVKVGETVRGYWLLWRCVCVCFACAVVTLC